MRAGLTRQASSKNCVLSAFAFDLLRSAHRADLAQRQGRAAGRDRVPGDGALGEGLFWRSEFIGNTGG